MKPLLRRSCVCGEKGKHAKLKPWCTQCLRVRISPNTPTRIQWHEPYAAASTKPRPRQTFPQAPRRGRHNPVRGRNQTHRVARTKSRVRRRAHAHSARRSHHRYLADHPRRRRWPIKQGRTDHLHRHQARQDQKENPVRGNQISKRGEWR